MEVLELVEPKVRQALGTASTACPGTASTACPGSAGQDRNYSPLGVLPSISPDSLDSTEVRASTAPALLDAPEQTPLFPTAPEEPPPMAVRPIMGVSQQAKVQNGESHNTFRMQRDLGSLAAMRQI